MHISNIWNQGVSKKNSIKPIENYDLNLERSLVREKALKASEAIRKVDPRLYEFWNLVMAKKRLYLVRNLKK